MCLSLAKGLQCSISVVGSTYIQKKKQHCCIGLITKSAFCNLHESGCQTKLLSGTKKNFDCWSNTMFNFSESGFVAVHTQDFGFKKRMLLGQETIAPMSLSGSFSDLS